MDKATLRSRHGYTFIELLVAISILGFVIAPFLALFTNSFSSIALSGRETTAINLCREKMESVKAIGYTAVYKFYITDNHSPQHENDLLSAPGFRRVTEINTVIISTAGTPQHVIELLHIKTTAYWMVRDLEYSETLDSYLACR